MDRREIVRIFNQIGGQQIRWNADLGEYVGTNGDRYPSNHDIEDVVNGLLKGTKHDAATVTGQRLDANTTTGNRR